MVQAASERRGESRVCLGATTEPLSAFLVRHGRSTPPILLKRLVPSTGHLYLEVHRTKHEVYVVDRVDPAAWPDGRGENCSVGVNPRARYRTRRRGPCCRPADSQCGTDGRTRRSSCDHPRPPHAPSPPSRRRLHRSKNRAYHIPSAEAWTVIEFQTPVYERLILASKPTRRDPEPLGLRSRRRGHAPNVPTTALPCQCRIPPSLGNNPNLQRNALPPRQRGNPAFARRGALAGSPTAGFARSSPPSNHAKPSLQPPPRRSLQPKTPKF